MNIGSVELTEKQIAAGKINIPAIKGDTGTGIKDLNILENGDLIVHLDNGTESNAGNINKIESASLIDGQLIITTTGGEEHNAGNVYDDELILERINRFNLNADTKTAEFNEICTIKTNEYNDLVEVSKNEIEEQKTNSITQIQEVSQKEKDDISKITEVINSRLSGLEEKEHTHANKALLDSITENDISKYNMGYEHSQSSHAPTNAQANVIESIKVNGVEQEINNKEVNLLIGDSEKVAQEVVDARGEFNTLGNRLDNVDKNIVISTKPFETDCFIEDSANSKIKFDKIIGGLVQDTRIGYNLLDIGDKEITVNGIVAKCVNGIITLNGTSNSSSDFEIRFPFNTNVPVDTYSFIPLGRDKSKYDYFILNASYKYSFYNNLNSNIINQKQESELVAFHLNIKANAIFNNHVIKPLLVKEIYTSEEQFPPYEQYGVSPSLSYPSELKYVGGNYDIEVSNNDESEKQIYPVDLTNYPLYSDKDYIYKKNNKLYVHNDFKKVNAKDLSWSMNAVGMGGITYKQFFAKTTFEPQTNLQNCIGKIFSNTFHVPSTPNTKGNYMYIGNTGLLVCVAPKNANGNYITTLDEWKTAIQDTYFIGKLATPTETEIQGESAVVEAELLYTQLEAIYNMKTYKGGTHITFDDIGKIQGEYIIDNGLAEAVREFNEINGYVDEARVIELIKQYK